MLAIFFSFTGYSQGVTLLANGSTPSGTDDAGDTIEYKVSVSNTGGESLSNVSLTLGKSLLKTSTKATKYQVRSSQSLTLVSSLVLMAA